MAIMVTCFLCISLSLALLITPSAAVQVIQEQPSPNERASDAIQFSLPKLLPRKLRHLEDATVQGYGGQALHAASNKNRRADPSGKACNKKEQKVVMHGVSRGGTWQEWIADDDHHHGGGTSTTSSHDISQFFTMDYSHVKRRRPIHNKSLPVGP